MEEIREGMEPEAAPMEPMPGENGADAEAGEGFSFILDIPLQVSVELGRTRMKIEDLLALSSSSVIELDRFAGEPVDVLVNRKLIARGECVVVHDKFGVRLTEIVNPRDRLEQLR